MTGVSRPAYVLDASIAVKWYLDDEEHNLESLEILRRYKAGEVRLIAPDHIRYEVANAISRSVTNKRVRSSEGQDAIADFLGWSIPGISSNMLVFAGYDIARQFGCAFYDGLYVGLAELTGWPLVHADKRLRNTLSGRFPLEVWIDDLDL
jgi:predicted nucleic acid-binding protein